MLVAFMLGLTGSIGHCTGMCGPVAVLLARRAAVSESKLGLVFLHLGRISTYMLFGLVAGGVGQLTGYQLSAFRQAQGVLALVAAQAFIYFAFSLLGWVPPPDKLLSAWIQKWGRIVRSKPVAQARPGFLTAYGLGLLWGLLPCGMVLAAFFTAVSSADAVHGVLSMFAFGLGTLPALLVLRWFAGKALRLSWSRYAAALVLFLVAAQFAMRGLSAWGAVGHMMVGEVMLW